MNKQVEVRDQEKKFEEHFSGYSNQVGKKSFRASKESCKDEQEATINFDIDIPKSKICTDFDQEMTLN